jgi:hypothetical protein
MMAKGQKRSNREIRKKAKKQRAAEATPVIMPRGVLSPISLPKKKG